MRLYIGTKFTSITIQPNPHWPAMWSVHQGDEISDMVNLARAKDAAISWFTSQRGRGLRRGEIVRWDTGKSHSGANPDAVHRTEAAE